MSSMRNGYKLTRNARGKCQCMYYDDKLDNNSHEYNKECDVGNITIMSDNSTKYHINIYSQSFGRELAGVMSPINREKVTKLDDFMYKDVMSQESIKEHDGLSID